MKYEPAINMILKECGTALRHIDEAETDRLIELINGAQRVFFVGVGRVFLSLEAVAKRLAHCGIDTVCVGQITEPAITEQDILIVASGSGESLIPVAIAKKAKSLGACVVLIGSNPQSTIRDIADHFVRLPVRTKLSLPDEIDSQQPMTSLFEQSLLLYGDMIALTIIQKRGLCLNTLWQYHANLE